MAKLAYDIILKPVITEKSMEMLTQGKYTFKVAKDSNKIEIAKAVEALFPGVKVAKVNTVNCRGVMKRMGRNEGYTPAWKKAVVTLAEGSKTIEFFDGRRQLQPACTYASPVRHQHYIRRRTQP